MSYTEFKYWKVTRPIEKLTRWIAHRLPKKLKMWVYFDVLAHSTTGRYGKTVVPKLTAMDAIDRYMKDFEL